MIFNAKWPNRVKALKEASCTLRSDFNPTGILSPLLHIHVAQVENMTVSIVCRSHKSELMILLYTWTTPFQKQYFPLYKSLIYFIGKLALTWATDETRSNKMHADGMLLWALDMRVNTVLQIFANSTQSCTISVTTSNSQKWVQCCADFSWFLQLHTKKTKLIGILCTVRHRPDLFQASNTGFTAKRIQVALRAWSDKHELEMPSETDSHGISLWNIETDSELNCVRGERKPARCRVSAAVTLTLTPWPWNSKVTKMYCTSVPKIKFYRLTFTT